MKIISKWKSCYGIFELLLSAGNDSFKIMKDKPLTKPDKRAIIFSQKFTVAQKSEFKIGFKVSLNCGRDRERGQKDWNIGSILIFSKGLQCVWNFLK